MTYLDEVFRRQRRFQTKKTMTHDTYSTILTLLFYAVLLTVAFITGKWLVSKERNY